MYSSSVFFLWTLLSAGSTLAAAAARVSPGDWSGGVAEYGYSPEATMGDSFTMAVLKVSYFDGNVLVSNESQDGKYGEGTVTEGYGIVVHVHSVTNHNDHTGCTMPLDGRIPQDGRPWIALIKRGGCNFEDKVKNAHQSRAAAVLIYNDKESQALDKMRLIDKRRNISAVFTYKDKGERLAELEEKGIEVTLNITIGIHCVRPSNNMNRTSVLFVSISFIVLMVMSISWLVFYYIQRFRYIHAKDRLSKRLCSAAKKALSKIPVKNLKIEDKEIQGDGECCAVCIEPYKLSDILRILPCRHDFHKSCIDPWLLEHRTCPMCKMDILKYYGFVFTGSQESILQLDAEEGDRRGPGGVSPLPRMPSVAGSYDVAHSERSSRASSPDELTPSLPTTGQEQGHYSNFSPQKRTRLPSLSKENELFTNSSTEQASSDKKSNSTAPSKSDVSPVLPNKKDSSTYKPEESSDQKDSSSVMSNESDFYLNSTTEQSDSDKISPSVKNTRHHSKGLQCSLVNSGLPRVHSVPSCSRQTVDTAVIAKERCNGDDGRRDAV